MCTISKILEILNNIVKLGSFKRDLAILGVEIQGFSEFEFKKRKISQKVPKSKNRPNFWSFWSYTFIFGEDGAYFIYKI